MTLFSGFLTTTVSESSLRGVHTQVTQCYATMEGNSLVLDKACVLVSDVNTLHDGTVLGQKGTVLVRQECLGCLCYLGGVEQRLCFVHWPDGRGVVFLEQ